MIDKDSVSRGSGSEGPASYPLPDLDALDPAALRARGGIKWGSYPDDVLPAWIADMDFPVAEPIRAWLARAVEESALGYPVKAPDDALPEVFAARMRARHGWDVDPARTEILADVVQGLYVALEVCAARGQRTLIQTPIYPPFLAAAEQTGRPALECPLVRGDEGYEIDLDALEVTAGRDAKVLALCSPHNPTGRVFRREELEALADLALRHDLVVVADEIHADLVLEPACVHVPFASLAPEIEARTITITSATKAFNTAGIRCALAAFGSEALHRRFALVPRRLRGGLNCFGSAVTRIAWEQGDPWLEAVRAYLRANRDHLGAFLASHLPEVGYRPPEATYLAWLDLRTFDLPPSPYEHLLEHARVALSDGTRFGAAGRGHARLNFATSRAILDDVLGRVAGVLARH